MAEIKVMVSDVRPYPEWTCDLLDDSCAQDFSAVVSFSAADVPRLLGRQPRVVERMPDAERLDLIRRAVRGDALHTAVETIARGLVRRAYGAELAAAQDDRHAVRVECYVEEILEDPRPSGTGYRFEVRLGTTCELEEAATANFVSAAKRKSKKPRPAKAAAKPDPALDNFVVTTEMMQRELRNLKEYLP